MEPGTLEVATVTEDGTDEVKRVELAASCAVCEVVIGATGATRTEALQDLRGRGWSDASHRGWTCEAHSGTGIRSYDTF